MSSVRVKLSTSHEKIQMIRQLAFSHLTVSNKQICSISLTTYQELGQTQALFLFYFYFFSTSQHLCVAVTLEEKQSSLKINIHIERESVTYKLLPFIYPSFFSCECLLLSCRHRSFFLLLAFPLLTPRFAVFLSLSLALFLISLRLSSSSLSPSSLSP